MHTRHDGGEREMAKCVGQKIGYEMEKYTEKSLNRHGSTENYIETCNNKPYTRATTTTQRQLGQEKKAELRSMLCRVYSNNYLFHISDCMRDAGGLAIEREEHSMYNDFDCVVASTELGIWQVNGNGRNRTLGPQKNERTTNWLPFDRNNVTNLSVTLLCTAVLCHRRICAACFFPQACLSPTLP